MHRWRCYLGRLPSADRGRIRRAGELRSCADGRDLNVLVVALGVDHRRGAVERQVTVEAVDAWRRGARNGDVVDEEPGLTRADERRGRRRVCGGREPAARERRVRRCRVAGGLVRQADGEVDLASGASQPSRAARVVEADCELARLARTEGEERRLAEVGGVVARHRSGLSSSSSEQTRYNRQCRDRGENLFQHVGPSF